MLLALLILFSVINVVYGAPDEFDPDGQDIVDILTGVFNWAYDIVIVLLIGMSIIAAIFIVKDSVSSGTDGRSGSSGIYIAKGIILATVALVAIPFMINMILGS